MESNTTNCVFCKIVAGGIPCFKLHEDEATLAFMDINPIHDGHCLVIAKTHYPTVFELPADTFAAVVRAAAKLAKAVNAAVRPDGLNLLQSNGPGAAQSVPHFHIHILPRRMGDELLMNWALKPGDMKRIGEWAERIRALL
jgi:histidine triad (HIT) family protein